MGTSGTVFNSLKDHMLQRAAPATQAEATAVRNARMGAGAGGSAAQAALQALGLEGNGDATEYAQDMAVAFELPAEACAVFLLRKATEAGWPVSLGAQPVASGA